jgi:hypothetical protein
VSGFLSQRTSKMRITRTIVIGAVAGAAVVIATATAAHAMSFGAWSPAVNAESIAARAGT